MLNGNWTIWFLAQNNGAKSINILIICHVTPQHKFQDYELVDGRY